MSGELLTRQSLRLLMLLMILTWLTSVCTERSTALNKKHNMKTAGFFFLKDHLPSFFKVL